MVGMVVEEELDFNGVFGAGALVDPSLAVLGAKGTIDISGFPGNVYGGTRLVVVELKFEREGEFALGLDFYRTAGEREDVFIGGDGETLDTEISFRGAVVTAVDPADEKAVVEVKLIRQGGRLALNFEDLSGFEYVIEESGDLREWGEVATVSGDGGEFVRVVKVERARRFFRVRCRRLPP